jgi:hypothetical protein
MMVIVQSNELKFQKLHEHHPFLKKGQYAEHVLIGHFL